MAVVGYMRLSREDGDNDESESISNQRKIIEKYAKDNGIIIDEYLYDDGYSGFSLDRPAFNKIKQGLNNGTIDTIIAKDLSRIGRHNAKVNLFLENIIESGKCVITINDNYNSYDEQSNEILGIQTWVNEKYIRDTSKKVIKSIRTLQEEGNYISSVPYGYKINPNKKGDYFIDERAAKYVRLVYDLYINGNGVMAIVQYLTKIGAPTATFLMKQDIEERGGVYKGNVATKWNVFTVKQMLRNDFYIGTLTLNKTRRRSINGKKVKQKDEDKLVFPNRHEAIIDIETFNLAQEVYKERTKGNFRGRRIQTRPNVFAGFLYCADCGKKFTSTSNDRDTRYVCITYNNYGTEFCSSHSVRESDIKDALMMFLRQCTDNMDEILDSVEDIMEREVKKSSANNLDINVLKSQIKKAETELQAVIKQKLDATMANPALADILSKNYDLTIAQKAQEIKTLNLQLSEIIDDDSDLSKYKKSMLTARELFQDILDSERLTKKQVALILNKIVVYEDGGLDFYLKANLDKLVTDKFTVKYCRTMQLTEDTYNYFYKENRKSVSATNGWKHATNNGIRIGYANYKKFFQRFIDNKTIEPSKGYNKGYAVKSTKEKFCNDYKLHIDEDIPPCLPNNDVIVRIIKNVYEWISDVNTGTSDKQLF